MVSAACHKMSQNNIPIVSSLILTREDKFSLKVIFSFGYAPSISVGSQLPRMKLDTGHVHAFVKNVVVMRWKCCCHCARYIKSLIYAIFPEI